MAPYRPNRKVKRNKKIMSDDTTQNEETPGISVGDLAVVLQLINVVTERGAFKAAELSSVGAIHDRVKAFVDFHTPKEEKTSEENTEETTEGAAATEESAE